MKLVFGGISSGKSEFAEDLIEKMHETEVGDFYYFTPAEEPQDDEMRAKVAAHRARRPQWLKTVECGTAPLSRLRDCRRGDTVLFDSVGTLIGRFIYAGRSFDEAESLIREFAAYASGHGINVIFVSEEAGMTLVALSEAGRAFQKMIGKINQIIAAEADEVFFIIAGIPQKLKG